MRHFLKVESLGLDSSRTEMLREIFELHAQVHDQALALVGPVDTTTELTMQQFRVLAFVVMDPGLTGHELGERLGVSPPTASGLVDRLVEKGLLERVEDSADRRIRRLHITNDGVALTRQMDSLLSRAMIEVIKILTPDELVLLRDGAQAMLDAMHRLAPDN